MKEQLIKQGFTEFDCGELGIHSLDEKTHIYLIPGKHWSLEVYISVGGASILTAAIPVSNIYEIETICNQNDILFRFAIEEIQPEAASKVQMQHSNQFKKVLK